MRSTLFIALAGSAVLAACSKTEPAAEPVRAVRTLTITNGAAGGTREYAAEIKARTESKLGFRVGGKITRRSANVGDTVKAGQVLAQLDPQDLKLAQESARAALAAAQTNLELANADYKRYKDLRDQGFISSAELERRDTALKSAQAQFDQARAQAGVQGNQAAYAALVADANGVITGVDAEPGMVVAAGTPVVRLAQDGPRDVVFSVPEDHVGDLRALARKPGALKVRLWGSNEAVSASIREVAAAADAATRTFQIKADIGELPARLGQTATVLIELPQQSGVVRLPLSAVTELQGRTSVWLVDKNAQGVLSVKAQPIQVGGADGNTVVVAGGLAPGQVVVTAGVHVLSPGQQVKMYVEPTAQNGNPAAMAPASAASR
ncbi:MULTISPECIES: efflux RND transporter periplasmic adaptor subunit [unclassified Rhizobacter]|uniref:efflux RND transporter periplasmic adaptor subunit n=1 Tax=unclassified Rhizobacter TaxID=2640088 RepID=UPI0006F9563E|nr:MULTISPECIES: efflux RND transporter periplasmic adaptor subunit [unclassified Rhizobacter]KQU77092.1 RND transporter [Rhizobacter sp. Root29]KQW14257.1 RND transporter [Rhizobacter sp. Root1238]KRB18622.1 RND transporter [Rhizobacter sp. Root16D2]